MQLAGAYMFLKKIISGITIFIFAHGVAGYAQEDEISDEDENSQEDENDNTNKKTGRKKRTIFPFHEDHPLYLHGRGQAMRAKQPTLIWNAHPPPHPGEKPQLPPGTVTRFQKDQHQQELDKWTKKANKFHFIGLRWLVGVYRVMTGTTN